MAGSVGPFEPKALVWYEFGDLKPGFEAQILYFRFGSKPFADLWCIIRVESKFIHYWPDIPASGRNIGPY